MKKTYRILSKIEKNKLDFEASILGDLKKELFFLELALKNNENKLKTEAKNFGNETLVYLGGYIKDMRHINNVLKSKINQKSKEVEDQESIVKDIFIEKKKYNILENKFTQKQNDKIEKLNNIELDEVGINIWSSNR